MKYEETGKKVNKSTGKNATEHMLKSVSTRTLLWYSIKRHKFAIVSIYAIGLTVYLFLPFLPGELFSLITG